VKFTKRECEQDRRDDRCYGIITARSEYTPYTTPFVIGSTRCSLQFTVVLPHVGRCASLTLSRHPKGMYKSKVGVGTSWPRRMAAIRPWSDGGRHGGACALARGVEDGLGIALVVPCVVGGAKEASGARGGVAALG